MNNSAGPDHPFVEGRAAQTCCRSESRAAAPCVPEGADKGAVTMGTNGGSADAAGAPLHGGDNEGPAIPARTRPGPSEQEERERERSGVVCEPPAPGRAYRRPQRR